MSSSTHVINLLNNYLIKYCFFKQGLLLGSVQAVIIKIFN